MTILRQEDGDRRTTVVEWERLQGFPDDWTVGSNSARYRQLGNAVTTNVVRAVAHNLLKEVAA